jgi:magnesium chelatase family protein
VTLASILKTRGLVMAFRLLSGDLEGIQGRVVEVEVDLIPALSSFVISGLPGKGIREARERIRSALENSGYRYPDRHRIVVNLAPAAWEKDGAVFDLPIALSILAASGQVDADLFVGWAALGELALDGRVRPVPGCLGIISQLRRSCADAVVVPASNRSVARAVGGMKIEGATSLRQALEVIRGESRGSGAVTEEITSVEDRRDRADLSDVRGHARARRALEIAATGEHPMLMIGPPGCGKSFLARRLCGLLPPLDREQQIEVTQIQEVCGSGCEQLVTDRPFRAPHHSVSWAGLIGGGSPPNPGEVTRAHHGVLFLDEFPEIARRSLEALREPMEEGSVTISRSGSSRTFPCRFLIIAAMNPCPCGHAGDAGTRRCRCSGAALAAYSARISGPMLDRFDIRISIEPISGHQLLEEPRRVPESSAEVARRVVEARQRALDRGQLVPNRDLQWRDRSRWAPLSDPVTRWLIEAQNQGELSTRGLTRLMRLGRTIADLRASEAIERVDLLEAMSLRSGSGPASRAVSLAIQR